MRIRNKINQCACAVLCMALLFVFAVSPVTVQAAEMEEPGTYALSARLSCYVNAMGGVEFGEPLVKSAVLNVQEDGSETITLYLTKSSVTIYSVTCDTFVDAAPAPAEGSTESAAVENGTVGYYDAQGQLQTEGASFTLSEDTALNPANEAVHYVDSITFPIDSRKDTYDLSVYVNSNVMGVQFGSVQSLGESGGYAAVLSVDWEGGGEPIATEPAATTPDAEEMEGLSIYRAEEDPAGTAEETQQAAVATQTAQEEIPWLLIVLAAALILCGIAVYVHAVKRKDDENA